MMVYQTVKNSTVVVVVIVAIHVGCDLLRRLEKEEQIPFYRSDVVAGCVASDKFDPRTKITWEEIKRVSALDQI